MELYDCLGEDFSYNDLDGCGKIFAGELDEDSHLHCPECGLHFHQYDGYRARARGTMGRLDSAIDAFILPFDEAILSAPIKPIKRKR